MSDLPVPLAPKALSVITRKCAGVHCTVSYCNMALMSPNVMGSVFLLNITSVHLKTESVSENERGRLSQTNPASGFRSRFDSNLYLLTQLDFRAISMSSPIGKF